MRVERQGRFIHIAIKNGNQERWFNIEEHEAQELALKLGEVLAEPKKPKFNVGDRVRVTRESIVSEKPADRELTVKDFFSEDTIRVEENNLVWPVDWLEKVEPLKFNVGDRVRVIKADETFYNRVSRVKEVQSNGNVQLIENDWFSQEWLELEEEGATLNKAIPPFVQKVIDDYKQVSARDWIVNDFMKDITLVETYGNENSDFSLEFLEWYAVKGNDKIIKRELKRS